TGILLKIPNLSNCLTTNHFLNLYAKSLGQILCSRIRFPEINVIVDYLITFLLKLFHEDVSLFNACLSTLPPM
ncbi:unnamed protein product, partial [Schistosoma turkestanicum]